MAKLKRAIMLSESKRHGLLGAGAVEGAVVFPGAGGGKVEVEGLVDPTETTTAPSGKTMPGRKSAVEISKGFAGAGAIFEYLTLGTFP